MRKGNSKFCLRVAEPLGVGHREASCSEELSTLSAGSQLTSQDSLHGAARPPACAPAGSADPRCTAEPRSRWPRPAAIPRGAAMAAAGLTEAALRAAAMSASACEPILTKRESVGRRRSAGTAEGAGCPAEMAVSEPGGGAAVSAMAGRGGVVVRGGLIGAP